MKHEIGSACLPKHDEGRAIEITGRDLTYGVPKAIRVTEREVAESLAEPVGAVIQAVDEALHQTEPKLAADLVEKGIVLTGGGALLANLDGVLRYTTGLPVTIAENPLTCVAVGTGRALDQMAAFDKVFLNAA